ncbi:hypothetical protein DLAC_04980 [Tieghemostelium lacteum]|uniref:Uncharacterized protein n=1 Tax=Tieghemostelium lacteum TaxID=361077 RepID=A0A151ZI11_TIELA|nr:hypothetical protein DLAC_04980 [Tieghemostelium lacteum]|eukprot:KYQ93606.1 hypothetical protein DLAC_04980 [Tieghemostelium lacteum]
MATVVAIEAVEGGSIILSAVIGFAKKNAINAGIAVGSALVSGYISNELNNWINKESELNKETMFKFDETYTDTHADDSMVIILVTEKGMWDKTIRVEKEDGTSFDIYTGNSVTSHPLCNIALARVKMDQAWTYSYRKPKFFGIWCQIGNKIKVHDIALKEWNRKVMVIYWDSDGDGYFKNNPGNQVSASELVKYWNAAQVPTL